MSDSADEPVAAGHDRGRTQPASRFAHLPPRIKPEDLVEEIPSEPARDPEFGRDPDRDWLLRTT